MADNTNADLNLGTVFVSNQETFDYKSRQEFFLQKEWEYEKRSVSSLLIGSGGGVSLLLGYFASSGSNISDAASTGLVISIVLFLFTLLLSGIAQFVLNEVAANQYQFYTVKNNHQNHSNAIDRLDKIDKLYRLLSQLSTHIKHDEEATSDTRFKLISNMDKTKVEYVRLGERTKKFEKTASWLLFLSCILFGLGVIFVVLTFIREII